MTPVAKVTGLSPYCGRFAPSPTGPLHFGSLIAATASYLQARVSNGTWLLRIENIDAPREVSGADQLIIRSLQAHGFHWDGDVLYQRDNIEHFQEVVTSLLERNLAYACTCSRDELKRIARSGPVGPIYPGTCRGNRGDRGVNQPHAIRIRTADARVAFHDRLQGNIVSDLSTDIGDFIIRRKDGLIGYSLAVVIDDHSQGITQVVRGRDLLDFTPAHIHLQNVLSLSKPDYMHVPIALNAAGEKLSKQTNAPPIDDSEPARNLFRCLKFLHQSPPEAAANGSVEGIWAWALENWNPENLTITRDSADD